jgi:aerobic carbon-monoxide dehydrogenase medium subunit
MNLRDYLFPHDIEECLAVLSAMEGRGRLVAGGTDLVANLEYGKTRAETLIDISSVQALMGFEIQEHELLIRAGATHGQISAAPRIQELWPALAKACGSVGSPQIRNVATLAGNVVNAQPAADSAVALVALGARAEILSAAGLRLEPVEALYRGLGQSTVDPSREILVTLRVPLPGEGEVNVYGRISPRNSLCLPIVNAAVSLKTRGGKILSGRIAMGPVSDRPFRPARAEAALQGMALQDREALNDIGRIAAEESNPRDSCLRGCSDYRRQLLRVLVRTLLEDATARAAGEA